MVHGAGEHVPDGPPLGQQSPEAVSWPRPSVKAKTSTQRVAVTPWLRGVEGGAFLLQLAMEATTTAPCRSRQRRPQRRHPVQVAQQLVLFSLPVPQPIGCCWDLICPEAGWEEPLRGSV